LGHRAEFLVRTSRALIQIGQRRKRFTFADVKAEVSKGLKDYYRLGGDVEVGAYYDVAQNWRIKLSGSYQIFLLGETKLFFTTQFATRYAISQNLDVRLELNRYDHNHEGIFSINYFF